MVSVVVFSSKGISFMNPIVVLFETFISHTEIDKCFSVKLIYFLDLISYLDFSEVKGCVHTFVTLLLLLVVRTEHSRSFAISFGVFASTLLIRH